MNHFLLNIVFKTLLQNSEKNSDFCIKTGPISLWTAGRNYIIYRHAAATSLSTSLTQSRDKHFYLLSIKLLPDFLPPYIIHVGLDSKTSANLLS